MHSSSSTFRRLSLGSLTLALAACGDPMPTPDTDGGTSDVLAPTIVASLPVDGARSIASDAALTVSFSEPMRASAGSVTARTEVGSVVVSLAWEAEGTELRVTAEDGWPDGATIAVDLADDFADVAGNTLAEPFEVSFSVIDLARPTIVSSTPVEGASVAAALDEVSFAFSEDVRSAGATLWIEGPSGVAEASLGTPSWTARGVSVSVSGLAHEGDYRVHLEGVRDVAGNPLDASALGAEGALDFSVGVDDAAPVVVDSDPSEGQLDVVGTVVTQIAVRFSEPMNETLGTATLRAGSASEVLEGAWSEGGRTLLLPARDRLFTDAAHRVELAGFEDLAGNALDGTVYLGDGALDFTTGDDLYAPHVAYTSPVDGAASVAANFGELVIVFSEAMDTSSDRVTVTGDGRSVELTGTWSMSGSALTVPVGARLQAGREYTVDLRGFRDRSGTAIDAAHPLLGDGVLVWTYAAPTGETCGEALTDTEATHTDGLFTWTLASGSVVRAEGAIACYPSTGSPGPDGVIRYRKTTADLAGGGSLLHVRAAGRLPTSGGASFEVFADHCAPLAAGADAARQYCSYASAPITDAWLDVGAGDYFVWVTNGSSGFLGATIEIEEVALPREGESCLNPLDTRSAPEIYTPPGSGGSHTWTIPAGTVTGMDRDEAFSCLPGATLGYDAVIAFEKTSDTSLVTFDVRPQSAVSTVVDVSRGTCDAGAPGHTTLGCESNVGLATPSTITVDGARGPLSAWVSVPAQVVGVVPIARPVAFPGAIVEVRELEPERVDTCANAIPLTVGANTITATRPHRAYAPSCLDDGGLTWFRFTAGSSFTLVRGNADSEVGVIDATSGAELRCGDGLSRGAIALVAPGTEVCLAVSSSPSLTSITIEALSYGGVRGTPTELGITRPDGEMASPLRSREGRSVSRPSRRRSATRRFGSRAASSCRRAAAPRQISRASTASLARAAARCRPASRSRPRPWAATRRVRSAR